MGWADFARDQFGVGGNYSSELMAYIFRWYIVHMDVAHQTHMSLETRWPVLASRRDAQRIFERDVVGLVAHRDENRHWLAVRVVDGGIWMLDSLEEPLLLTLDEFVGYLGQWQAAFLVRDDLLLQGTDRTQATAGCGEVVLPVESAGSAPSGPQEAGSQMAEDRPVGGAAEPRGSGASGALEAPGQAGESTTLASGPHRRLLRRYRGGAQDSAASGPR